MSYCIDADERIDDAIRRIAQEQIDKAIDEAAGADAEVAIHSVRKRCKKLRGLIRLVRPGFADYRNENKVYRDAARQLSALRDATTSIETCKRVLRSLADGDRAIPRAGPLIAIFERRRDQRFAECGVRKRLESFAKVMRDARTRVSAWSLEDRGFDALAGGYGKTYERTREAMSKAYTSPSAEHFHRWRKRVKYHRYHLALLSDIWPTVMESMHDQAKFLSDLLGEDHDLAVFRSTLLDDADTFGRVDQLQMILLAIDQRRSLLQAQALPLGERLSAERRKRHVQRLGCWWQARQTEHQLALHGAVSLD